MILVIEYDNILTLRPPLHLLPKNKLSFISQWLVLVVSLKIQLKYLFYSYNYGNLLSITYLIWKFVMYVIL